MTFFRKHIRPLGFILPYWINHMIVAVAIQFAVVWGFNIARAFGIDPFPGWIVTYWHGALAGGGFYVVREFVQTLVLRVQGWWPQVPVGGIPPVLAVCAIALLL